MKPEPVTRLGQMLYWWRVIQHLSLADVAADLGVSVGTVMWLERGQPPTRGIWYRLEPWLVEGPGSLRADLEPMPGGRGTGSMPLDVRREIARAGGRAVHQQGRAHKFTSEQARIAGRKGGTAPRRKKA